MSARNKSRSPADRAGSAAVPRNNRSRIANGSSLGIDQRTRAGRRWRDIYLDAMARTGGRNQTLCRSLASLTVQHEEMDAKLARGEPVDVDTLVKVAGAIGRVMVRAGLDAEHEVIDATDQALTAIRSRSAEVAAR